MSSGPKLASGAVAVSQDQVLAYLAVSGDDNPIHVDPDAAAQLGLGGTVVPGMLLAGIATSHLAGATAHRAVLAVSSRFVRPILVGQPFAITERVMAVDSERRTSIVRLSLVGPAGLASVVEVTLAEVG